MTTPRLFVEAALAAGQVVNLDADAAGYLGRVLRLGVGGRVLAFNGRDGEWAARIAVLDKKGARLSVETLARPQTFGPDVWALFAPVKRQQTDWLVEKAVELGAARLLPVLTRRTIADTVRTDRFTTIAREAAEQCERLDAPEVADAAPLDRALVGWPAERLVFLADERGVAPALTDPAFAGVRSWAVLTGPEGGFDPTELAWLRGLPFVRPISLGPRILRAETAMAAALAISVAAFGGG
ncbi:MAG: 16S rRNA (uracil(1498)-N(3))-methyltransferase [Caulobacterales bacterium]|jgi:16S rRNA (uracil1498-N3)-methyltransferase